MALGKGRDKVRSLVIPCRVILKIHVQASSLLHRPVTCTELCVPGHVGLVSSMVLLAPLHALLKLLI